MRIANVRYSEWSESIVQTVEIVESVYQRGIVVQVIFSGNIQLLLRFSRLRTKVGENKQQSAWQAESEQAKQRQDHKFELVFRKEDVQFR